jgi:AraC-like DNA-binding protein
MIRALGCLIERLEGALRIGLRYTLDMPVVSVSAAADSTHEDPVADVLFGLRAMDSCYMRCELSAPWGIRIPACPHPGGTSLHFLARGRAWLTAEGRRMTLDEGDLVLFLHGDENLIADAPDTPEQEVYTVPELSHPVELRHGGGGQGALVLSAGARLGSPDHPVVSSLPAVLFIGGSGDRADEWVQATLRALAAEAAIPRPGGETIITRLCDVLILQAIRCWIESSPDAHQGWLLALRDEHVGRALAAMHRDPARPWTVASLAQVAHLSRAAFAQRFVELTGDSPIAYLAEHRMRLAASMLRDEGLSPGEVAYRVGYGSLAAFSRAFKRVTGSSPGAARRP